MKVLAKAVVLPEGSAGEGSASQLIHVVVPLIEF